MMTDPQFKELFEDCLEQIESLSKAKGSEYSPDTDRLQNFKEGSKVSGLPVKTYAWALVCKHITSVRQHNLGEVILSQEQLREKYGDIRLYTILLEGIERYA